MSIFSRLLSLFRIEKWPSKTQWGQFFKILSKKEKLAFFSFALLAVLSLTYLSVDFYLDHTEIKPYKGGVLSEGIIGQPRFINPIYANSDADRDLTQLVFSGLMKYNENLEVVPDLVKSYEIEEDGKVYKLYLKENLLWHDKTPITADDIIFTIKTIQNPDYKSPIRANWIGVEVEKIGDLAVKFSLKQPYAAFVENCTVKILPEHIWENISSENFPLEIYNLKAVGSGPYKIKEIKQNKSGYIESVILSRNSLYFGKEPYISEIRFTFFDNEEKLLKAAKSGKINGLSLSARQDLGQKWQTYSLLLPRYFAVFFNQEKSKVLADINIRKALNYGTDKEAIIKQILGQPDATNEENLISLKITDSPILPGIYGFDSPSFVYGFDIEKAKSILEESGYKDENQDGFREKNTSKEPAFQFKSDLKSGSQGTEVQELQKCLAKFPDIYPEGETSGYFGAKTEAAVIKFQEKYSSEILEPAGLTKGTGKTGADTRKKLNEVCFPTTTENQILGFTLMTVDQPQLEEVAKLLRDQWGKLGIAIEIKKLSPSQLEQDYIKPRNYEALLFGEVLGGIPDLLPFWHSSQTKDPGLNLAGYNNKNADKLLEDVRKSLDPQERSEKLSAFQDILIEDSPAVFLYCPDYIYFVSKEIHNVDGKKIIDPSQRFLNIENWYAKTKRAWK
jgi:peptide/nickel transport system substrate-binding protein